MDLNRWLCVAVALVGVASATSGANTTLLFTSKTGVLHLDRDGTLLQYRNGTFQWWQDHNLVVNPRNGTACWVTAPEDQELVGNMRCASVDDISIAWDLPTPKNFRVNDPDAIEVDPDTNNWYITVRRTSYVCSYDFQTCAKIGTSGGNLRYYAAYDIPNRLLFVIVTDEFGPYRMDVMGLDGSGRRTIADNSSLVYPTALALDSEDKMVYWIDNNIRTAVHRCTYEGKNKELVAELGDGIADSHTRDLKIVGHSVFVMYGDQQKVSHVDKNTLNATRLVNGRVTNGTTEVPIGEENLLSLSVVSELTQPEVENACATDNAGCEDLCVPTVVDGAASYTCFCKPGEELVDTACFKIEPATVVVVRSDSLQAVDVETGNASIILANLSSATKLDFFYESEEKYILFWLDDGGLFRGQWEVGGQVTDVQEIVPAGGTVREVTVDWNQHNVLWIEQNTEASEYDDDGMWVKLANVYGNSSKTIVTDIWGDPSALIMQTEGMSFAVHEMRFGRLEFRSWDMQGENEYFGFPDDMDEFDLPYQVRDIAEDLSALSEPDDERYFWINPINGSIEVTSNEFTVSIKSKSVLLTHPSLKNSGGLDVYADRVFWTDKSTGLLMSADSETGQDVRTLGSSPGSAVDLRGVRVLHPRKQPRTRFAVCDSENNGCSDMCLLVFPDWSRKGVCACPDGSDLAEDDKTCK